jgi:hypothetical protein
MVMARKSRTPRNLKKAIAVIGEGISEQEYFISLKKYKRYSFKVKPELPQNSSYKQIFKKAKELIKNDSTDIVYCLIDMDNIISMNQQESFKQASAKLIKSVGKGKVHIINSNPCFEVWFLFHFMKTIPNVITDSAVSDKLKQYPPFTNYDKSRKFFKSTDLYKSLNHKVDDAIQSAKKVNPSYNVSFTEVWKVLEDLEEIDSGNSRN